MSRTTHRIFILDHIVKIRDELAKIPKGDRLQVIAEALCDLNDYKPKEERTEYASCGCYGWDIAMDYRPHHERYPNKEEKK